MRGELLKKRKELKKEIDEMNKVLDICEKKKSYQLSQLRKENIKKYQFINNLLKEIK